MPGMLRSANSLRRVLDGLRVLVVDDDEDVRDTLVSTLEYLGASVREASSARAGRDALDAEVPDAILSDLAMPGEDGFSFMASVRARDDDAATVPAAAVTAYGGPETERRALASGFSFVVSKPFDLAAVAGAVLALCDADEAARSAVS